MVSHGINKINKNKQQCMKRENLNFHVHKCTNLMENTMFLDKMYQTFCFSAPTPQLNNG